MNFQFFPACSFSLLYEPREGTSQSKCLLGRSYLFFILFLEFFLERGRNNKKVLKTQNFLAKNAVFWAYLIKTCSQKNVSRHEIPCPTNNYRVQTSVPKRVINWVNIKFIFFNLEHFIVQINIQKCFQ